MTTRPLSTPGRRPYGTHLGEAQVLARIIALRARGWTWQAIADDLTGRGWKRRNGKPWTASGVAGVHRDPD